MARGSGKLEDILQAVVDRLIAQIPATCNAATCYLSLDPDAKPAPNAGSLIYVVAPTSGSFNDGYIDGGGQSQCTVAGGVIVKIHSPMQLDKPQHDEQLLKNATRGVLAAATAALKALVAWSPVLATNEITRDPLIPAGFVIGRSDRSMGFIELTFTCTFDWDLS